MTETRKIRENLTKGELERMERYGSLSFKPIHSLDMRVEPFIPSREQHGSAGATRKKED